MKNSINNESDRTTTLRRVGRNLVNVQRIELMMKFLLQMNFSAPMREFEVQLKKHIADISRKTLGTLISELGETVFVTPDKEASEPQVSEVWLSSKFAVPIDAEALIAWSKEWETVRTERNRLVHLMLANVDFNSVAQCRKLTSELDAQNEIFLSGIAFLGPIFTAVKQTIAEMASGELKFDPPLPEAPQK
jgi:hypothetical protein